MDEEIEDTQYLKMFQPLLGAYPYILIQFEPYNNTWRVGVDYDHLSDQDVIDTLRSVLQDFEEQ